MPSLGDVYVDVHANTKDLKPEVRKAATEAGDDGGQRFSKSWKKQTDKSMGRFEKDFKSSIDKALSNLPDVELNADSSDAQREIQKLRGELRAMSDMEIGVDIDAAGALAHLGVIRVALAALSKDADIDIGVNSRGALGALMSITNLLPQFSTAGAGAGGVAARLGVSMGGVGASAAAAAPLVIAFGVAIALLVGVAGAAAGALGGLALALGAPLGAAGAGGGLFALLAGKYVSETNKVIDQVKKLKEEGKTGEANALVATLTSAQKAYMKAREGFSKAFEGFTKQNSVALLTPIQIGLEKLTTILKGKGLTALVEAVANSLTKFLGSINTAGLDKMLMSMSKLAGGVLDNVFSSLKSFGSILGSIFGAGKDLGVAALDGMSNALQRFATYLKSTEGQKQLQEFFTWVQTHGPGILQNFIDIGGGIFKFIKAMTPAGEAFLTFLGFFGKFGFLAPVFKAAMAIIIGAFGGLLIIISGVTGVLGGLFTLIGKIPGTPDWVDGIGKGLNGISTGAWDASQKMTDLILETDKASKQKVNIPISADPKKATETVGVFVKDTEALHPVIYVASDTSSAETTTSTWADFWDGKTLTLKISATISAAATKFIDFVNKYGSAQLRAWGIGGASGGRLPAGFASGGKVPGTTPSNRAFDNVAAVTRRGNPLRVQSGEWIINSAASRQNDRLLAAINSGFNAQRAFKFNAGGLVPAGPKGYASGGRVGESSTVYNSDVSVNFDSAPVSTAKVIQEVDWWSQYGTRTRMRAASV